MGGPAGIGGVWAKPLSLRWVHRIFTELGMPISGSNGIYDHRDVIEFLMTGAKTVQIGSVLMLKGIKYLPKVIRELEEFMDSHGYPDIESMFGIASKRSVRDYSEQFRKRRMDIEVKTEACKNPKCTICIQTCFYEALSQANGKVGIDHRNCIGCDLCVNTCPFDANAMHLATDEQARAGEVFQIPDTVFEVGKFEKDFVRGIKLSSVKD
jgi:dihydroorotate dehydrogenase (fumarate)/dihydropyrimidine dehydrogenase (NAD+) subunit PreA